MLKRRSERWDFETALNNLVGAGALIANVDLDDGTLVLGGVRDATHFNCKGWSLSSSMPEISRSSADAFRNVEKSIILIVPKGDGLTILRKREQLTKRRTLPVDWRENYRNYASFTRFVTLHGTLHLFAPAVL